MRVAFRVDSSQRIGTGHLMRCLNLARALDRLGHVVCFICRDHPGSRLKPLIDSGLSIHRLPAPDDRYEPENPHPPHLAWLGVPLEVEIAQVQRLLEKIGPFDWVIVDHYALEAQWQEAVRPFCDRVGAIDELLDRDHRADWLLDSTLFRPSSAWRDRVPDGCALLVGSDYALLEPAFAPLHQVACKRHFESVERVVIALGGAADGALYARLLQAVRGSAFKNAAIDLVASAQIPGFSDLVVQAKALGATLLSDLPSLADRLMQADLAIGAAGVSAYERACLGLPTAMIELADNQRANIEAFSRAKAAIALGRAEALKLECIVRALDGLDRDALAQMRLAALGVCDGRGVKRAVVSLLADHKTRLDEPVRLRLIEAADEARIYGWQSSPGVRRFCRNPQVPTSEEHHHWMSARLIEQAEVTLVVECGTEAAGLIRLIPLGEDYELSVLIAPNMQGRGVGAAAIALACELVPAATLYASIAPANTASIKLFEREGFKPQKKGWWKKR